MLKYAVAFDSLNFSHAAMQYATSISKQCHAFLTGVFLDDHAHASFHIYDLIGADGTEERKIRQLRAHDRLVRQDASLLFKNTCIEAGVDYISHHDEHNALQDLLNESVFSDLLILDRRETFSQHNEKLPSRFIRDVLSNTSCPVLLISSDYKEIEKIIIIYDGEPSSVYALKMFHYVLQGIKPKQTAIWSIKNVESDKHLPFQKRIKELITKHSGHVSFVVEKGIAEDIIPKKLKEEKDNTLIVLGAYRRSMLSRRFRSSMADILMHELDLPLFIAHPK